MKLFGLKGGFKRTPSRSATALLYMLYKEGIDFL